MVGVFEIDQVSLWASELWSIEVEDMARLIIFFHTGIDASSAANAPWEFQAVAPKSIRNGFFRADW